MQREKAGTERERRGRAVPLSDDACLYERLDGVRSSWGGMILLYGAGRVSSRGAGFTVLKRNGMRTQPDCQTGTKTCVQARMFGLFAFTTIRCMTYQASKSEKNKEVFGFFNTYRIECLDTYIEC